MTIPNAAPVMARYTHVCIQNTGMSSNRSRKVPPPIAVTNPMVYAPKRSKFLYAASRMPLMAKANVPIASMMNRKVDSMCGGVLWVNCCRCECNTYKGR